MTTNCCGHLQMLLKHVISNTTLHFSEWATRPRDSRPSLTTLGNLVRLGYTGAGSQPKEDSPPWDSAPGSRTWLIQAGQAKLEDQESSKREKEKPTKKKKYIVRKVFQEVERGTSLNKQLTWMKTKWRPLSGQLTGWGKMQRLRQAQATLGEDRLSKENTLESQPVLCVVEYRA